MHRALLWGVRPAGIVLVVSVVRRRACKDVSVFAAAQCACAAVSGRALGLVRYGRRPETGSLQGLPRGGWVVHWARPSPPLPELRLGLHQWAAWLFRRRLGRSGGFSSVLLSEPGDGGFYPRPCPRPMTRCERGSAVPVCLAPARDNIVRAWRCPFTPSFAGVGIGTGPEAHSSSPPPQRKTNR